jgi:hypothetical protein
VSFFYSFHFHQSSLFFLYINLTQVFLYIVFLLQLLLFNDWFFYFWWDHNWLFIKLMSNSIFYLLMNEPFSLFIDDLSVFLMYHILLNFVDDWLFYLVDYFLINHRLMELMNYWLVMLM